MDIKDVEVSLRQADGLFKVNRLNEAKPLYENALVCLEAAYPQGHPDIVYCLGQIGDTCYLLNENEQSLNAFGRLLSLRERQQGVNPSDLVINLFKLAKLCERLGRLDDAETLYQRAEAEAEKSLFAGHPLLGAVMEGHAIMLKRAKRNPELANKLSQQSREIKQMAGDMSKMPGNVVDAFRLNTHEEEGALDEVEQQEAKEAELQAARETLQKLFQKFKKIALIILAVVLVGVGITFGINQAKIASDNAVQKEIVKKFTGEAKDFISSDRLDKLTFLPNGVVDGIIEGVHRKVPFKVVPFKTGFGTSEPAQRSYKAIPEGLRADGGHILWKVDAPELKVLDRARSLAEAVQKYYQEKSEYPTDLAEIIQGNDALATNTISNEKEDIPVMSVGRERDWHPENAQESTKAEEDLANGKLLEDEPELKPGAIHCYYLQSGDPYVGTAVKGFFMRIAGSKGTLLPGRTADKCLVIALKNGRNDPFMDPVQPREVTEQDKKINSIRVLEQKE